MRKISLAFGLCISFAMNVHAQKIDTLRLKVAGYRELNDCFILRTYNLRTSDSVFIISVKANLIFKSNYDKIIIGKEYDFACDENNSIPVSPTGIALRVKNTYVWVPGDDPKKVPLYSLNAKGLYVGRIR